MLLHVFGITVIKCGMMVMMFYPTMSIFGIRLKMFNVTMWMLCTTMQVFGIMSLLLAAHWAPLRTEILSFILTPAFFFITWCSMSRHGITIRVRYCDVYIRWNDVFTRQQYKNNRHHSDSVCHTMFKFSITVLWYFVVSVRHLDVTVLRHDVNVRHYDVVA